MCTQSSRGYESKVITLEKSDKDKDTLFNRSRQTMPRISFLVIEIGQVFSLAIITIRRENSSDGLFNDWHADNSIGLDQSRSVVVVIITFDERIEFTAGLPVWYNRRLDTCIHPSVWIDQPLRALQSSVLRNRTRGFVIGCKAYLDKFFSLARSLARFTRAEVALSHTDAAKFTIALLFNQPQLLSFDFLSC